MSVEIFEVRPRFKKMLSQSAREITNGARQSLQNNQEHIIGKVDETFIVLQVPVEDRKFWTPQLQISLEETEEGTIARGLYGPRPDIWLLYMFLYALGGFITMIITIIGLSQYSLGLSAYILWLVPFLLGGIFVLWFTSRTGQRLGQGQKLQIQQFVEQHLLIGARDVE